MDSAIVSLLGRKREGLSFQRITSELRLSPRGKQILRKRLKRLGYANVEVRIGDGYFGWQKCSPFDAIIVTAAADHIPPSLVRQLKNGGKMCIPIGQPYYLQVLKLLEKNEKGEVRIWNVIPVRFVPLTRAEDWKDKSWE